MGLHVPHPKITEEHTDRFCFIYIRQSSPKAVRENTASTALQYELRELALKYGWSPERIIIIDDDQGTTASVYGNRPAFWEMFEQVGRGIAGAVFGINMDRLSRDDADFAVLVRNCRLNNTLLIDHHAVYDPRDPNDSLLLGIKGSMAAQELSILKSRLGAGLRKNAKDGTFRLQLPPGYLYEPLTTNIVFDPDPEVQRVIRYFFELYNQLGSAYGVYKEFQRQNQLFPSRSRLRINKGELQWRPLTVKIANETLHHPIYAGVYVYGRKKLIYTQVPGQVLKFKPQQIPRERKNWVSFIPNHHPAFISLNQFELNQQRLKNNLTPYYDGPRGFLGPGSALLQRIAVCGHCGRNLQIKYPRGNYSLYSCLTKGCHTFTGESPVGVSVDREVEKAFLQALNPAKILLSLESLKRAEADAQVLKRQHRERIEQAEREAVELEKEYKQADKGNRRVKALLGRKWEEKLAAIEKIEMELSKSREVCPPSLDAKIHKSIVELKHKIPVFWHAASTTNIQRKTLLQALVKTVTLTRAKKFIHIKITWQTGAKTELQVELPKITREGARTAPMVITRIRELVGDHSDTKITDVLNAEGFLSAKGNKFTVVAVRHLRLKNGIETGCPDIPTDRNMQQRGDGLFTVRAVAQKLNVGVSTVHEWCKKGILRSVQSKPESARWIELTPELIRKWRKPRKHSK